MDYTFLDYFNRYFGSRDVPRAEAFNKETICVMAVDNLPCELPRDASDDFGKDLMERVVPYLFKEDVDAIIERASICKNGKLTSNFEYLSDYAY